MDSPDATNPNFDETATAAAGARAIPNVSTDHSRSADPDKHPCTGGGCSKRLVNRQRLIIALCVALSAPPALAQEAADPALETYFAGNAAYNRKLFPIAAVKYEEFISRYANHEKAQLARYGLGLSQFALKKYDAAIPNFQKLLGEQKLDAKIQRGRLTLLHAQCLLYAGKKDEAQARLVAAASNLTPGVHRTGAIAAVSDLFFAQGDWEKTVVWARKLQAVKAEPSQLIRAGYQEGFALYKLAKFPEAIAVLDKTKSRAAEAKSEAWVTRLTYLLSECHVSSKSLDKAEASLQAALAGLRGTSANDARYRLATIKFARKKWIESQADFEVFLQENKKPEKDDPRIREARFHVARCLMEQKETGKANSQFAGLGNGQDEVAGRAVLWNGRLYSREGKYEQATNSLRAATDKPWYKTGFSPQPGEKPGTVVADIDFEYANALMLQKSPNWELALKFLNRVQSRRGDYGQMPEVRSQQAICQHKLKQFDPSFKTTAQFIAAYAEHELIGDVRFLHAENLFLLNRLDEAATAYGTFISAHQEHANRLAAEFRIAQVHHHKQKWVESNKLAVPLLAKKPDGRLFAQLSFVVGENYFRSGEWAKAVEPFESFVGAYVKQPKNPKGKPELTKAANVDTALMQMGVSYARLGNTEDAIDRLNMLVTHYASAETPHMPLALSEQGKLLYDTEALKRARPTLERFVNERKNKNLKVFQSASANAEVGRVHYYLGWIDAVENRHPEAAANFQIAAAQGGSRLGKDGSSLASDAALQQGIALVSAKEFEKAAQHLQQVGNQYKEHPRKDLVLYYTGLAYARVENWGAAAGFFKRVIDEHPKAPFADKAVYEWAWCERSQKRNEQATERYELLLKQYPKSGLLTKVQSELAELNLDVGAQDAVIAKLTETMKSVKDPKLKFELQYQLASAHFKKKDYENSAKMFESLIPEAEKSKLLPSILFQAGESRLLLTEAAPARDHFFAANKANAKSSGLAESILMRLAETQNLTAQHKESQESYRVFLERYKKSQWLRNARYGMAFALEKQEQYKKAIGEYGQLLSREGDNPLKMDKWMVQARYQIGECYYNLREYDKAMAEFVSVDANAQGYPDWQAKAVLEMGRILVSKGKRSEALTRMQEVIKRFPKTKAATVAQKYLDKLRTAG
ncbi:MAG: tetratricopeptide repeat protein [Planctomycetota bacterium]|nr:tetratricopeptide repeat protein [Planctomycetota bacterium]